jgi:hypothetical protein
MVENEKISRLRSSEKEAMRVFVPKIAADRYLLLSWVAALVV